MLLHAFWDGIVVDEVLGDLLGITLERAVLGIDRLTIDELVLCIVQVPLFFVSFF